MKQGSESKSRPNTFGKELTDKELRKLNRQQAKKLLQQWVSDDGIAGIVNRDSAKLIARFGLKVSRNFRVS